MHKVLKWLSNTSLVLSLSLFSLSAHAQDAVPVSKCLAMVDAGPEIQPRIMFANAEARPIPFIRAQAASPDVLLTYVDHAVWQITSPGGVTAATDYYGLPLTPVPDIATMNNAHRTHWTPAPDLSIKHVLRGWSNDGISEAQHAVVEGDMFVRNVPTDIRSGGEMRRNGNSIFIFEVGGL